MDFDVIIRNGWIIDGSGSRRYHGDIGIKKERILSIGDLSKYTSNNDINAEGLIISPGFINMLSWAVESLIEDGRALSDVKQGVTLEVFGEGWSMGPLNDEMKIEMVEQQGDIKYDIEWTSLNEYLEYLVKKGISPNIASFIGATTVRIHEIGYEDREPTSEELEKMKTLVEQAMKEGALGVGSSLIYAPAFYATTEELTELCKVVKKYGGMHISHIRSEGNQILEALDELFAIAKETDISSEIYHLKVAGKSNWEKLDTVIDKINKARDSGLKITTDMYCYIAGATGLNASMPPWVQEGGLKEWKKRLQDQEIRKQVRNEMLTSTQDWENLYFDIGPENILLVGFKSEKLKQYTGKTLAEVAKLRGKNPEETAMDLVIEDDSRVGTIYFIMNEENIKKKVKLPYMSFGSDAEAPAPEGVFLKSNTHPRAYGNFARLLGKYVRDEKIITLEEAIRKLTSLPASNLKIKDRGLLKEGNFADIVIFDFNQIKDRATYENPHQLASGVVHVFNNGKQVLKDGEHTGVMSGQIIRGPGWNKY